MALSAFYAEDARSELPPVDYPIDFGLRAAATASDLNREGRFTDAEALANASLDVVADDPGVLYELAFSLNRQGRGERAEKAYLRVTVLEPGNAAAWYDLGELWLEKGDLDGAQDAFSKATSLRPEHWVGPFRLAEVAGRKGDVETFERWLKAALRNGFTPSLVVQDPTWKGFFRDASLGDVIRRLITVYGDETLLDAFRETP